MTAGGDPTGVGEGVVAVEPCTISCLRSPTTTSQALRASMSARVCAALLFETWRSVRAREKNARETTVSSTRKARISTRAIPSRRAAGWDGQGGAAFTESLWRGVQIE